MMYCKLKVSTMVSPIQFSVTAARGYKMFGDKSATFMSKIIDLKIFYSND